MSDVVVTVPKRLWREWIAEGDLPGEEAQYESHFWVWGFVPVVKPGDRVYVVAFGRLRGYAPLTRTEQMCSLNPRMGCLVREGGAQCSVVKFRGEFPPSFSVTFDAVDGFTLRRERLQARSPSEQAVMRFFNNSASDWYGRAEIEAAVSMNRRTLQRTLAVLAKRGWLATEGEDLQRRYRISPNTAGVFG